MADPLADAQARIDRKRRELAAAEPTAPPLARILSMSGDDTAAALASVPTFECSECGERFTGKPYEGGICCECFARELRASTLRLPGQELPGERAAALGLMGVPPRYTEAKFEEPDPWPPGLADWTGDPWAALLAGPDHGAGKSMLAAELLLRVSRARRVRGAWARAGWLIGALYGRRGEDARREAFTLEAAPVLVVDELGRAHSAEQTWDTFSDFLGVRYDHARPTILTTNLDRRALQAAEGSLWDRLREGLVVPVLGKSRRVAR